MESRALQLQERDVWLHRLLPFGLVLAFLIASVVIAFASPAASAAALIFRMAGVLTAYLTGRAPNIRSDAAPPTPPAPPP
jgi:energy-coupling factor transporter transmembrane protein EcfT